MAATAIEKRAKEHQNIFLSTVLKEIEEQGISQVSETVTYLIERGLITSSSQLRFIVGKEYPKELRQNEGVKQRALRMLEAKYDIPESTIKCWLNRFKSFFPSVTK